MADAAVQFLLENLTQLLIHHVNLISNVESEVKQLVENVKFFKSFLKKVSSKKRRKDETLRTLVVEIRDVIYDADDVIDAFVTQAAEKKTRSYFSRNVSSAADLIPIANKVGKICDGINKIYGGKDRLDFINLAIDDGELEEPLKPTPSRNDNVVGLEDEVEKVVGYLTDQTGYLDVISIIGMPGLGKTTLTGKIYHDPRIQYRFPIRIWVYVSQEFIQKEVFLSILRQLKTKLDEDVYGKKSAEQLAEEIATSLEGETFLLVMDDVWEPSDWDKLKVALPEHNVTGKVMITSRQEGVGKHANRDRPPHKLRPLNPDESCELLQLEVFGKRKFPSYLEKVGSEIAYKCEGLPLAIVVIGGVLTTKILKSAIAWEKVSTNVTTFLQYDSLNRMYRIILMSYEKLPFHLKECFLYLGMFPEDFEIPAWKLIRMWIAEGLIQPEDDISMEDVAELHLNDLINRNLLRVEKVKADGRVKTCRIHDMLRDFCKREGGKDGDNFFQEIKQCGDGGLLPLGTEGKKHRRLCIHSNVLEFLSKSPKNPFVRSFVTFSEDIEMPTKNISPISAAFKLLRVLEARPLKFGIIPSDFYHLIHLRYLVLFLKMDSHSKPATLPTAFNKLWNMQTLIVDTTSRVLEMKADVMRMTQLRHLKSNASITLAQPDKDSNEGEKLQTLCTMSPKSCTRAILGKACNLKKLGIRGKIAQFLDGKIGSIGSLRKLTKLEKLKLWNDTYPEETSTRGKLYGLPSHYLFPPTLRSLTLVATYLDWTHMSVLAFLENLQVLKLKDNAFVGSKWTVSLPGFDSLEFLHIERSDMLIWEASAIHFPNLKQLELHNCGKVKQIPIELAQIPQLEHLDIQHCKEATSSAMKIAAARKNVSTTFKLSIIPPVDICQK